jgi:hypothetical protein
MCRTSSKTVAQGVDAARFGDARIADGIAVHKLDGTQGDRFAGFGILEAERPGVVIGQVSSQEGLFAESDRSAGAGTGRPDKSSWPRKPRLIIRLTALRG